MSKAAELAALIGSGQAQSNRNLIINSAMQVAQRGTAAVAAGAGTYPSIDRWKAWEGTDGAFTVEQSTTTPAGFTTALKAQVTTADGTLAAGQYAQISQQIEAQNLQRLDYGTNNAKTITLSFHVRSSKTGSYSITIYKDDTTRYLFSKSYTIDSADTWEKKTITIAPDSNIKASGGAIANDNGIGVYVFWNLAGGTTYDDATDNAWSSNTNHFHTSDQVNWMDNTNNNFYLTGVQLEIGETATAFEHEDIGTTLEKCQRYYVKLLSDTSYDTYGPGIAYVVAQFYATLRSPTRLRGNPTIGSSGNFAAMANGSHHATDAAPAYNRALVDGMTVEVYFDMTTNNLVAGHACQLRNNNDADAYIEIIAEL